MTVDKAGIISTIANHKIQSAFQPVIDQATTELVRLLGCQLHSLYLYGSIAHGRAVAFRSDLDLSLILQQLPTDQQNQQLALLAQQLQSTYPQVTKVDFDIGTVAEVNDPANKSSWGYWLKHQCRCIYGQDLSQQFALFYPSRTIALAVNGDFSAVLQDYIERISALTPKDKASARLQKEAARKLVRATNVLRDNADNDWPDSLADYAVRFNQRYPALASEMNYFLAQCQQPDLNTPLFITRLAAFKDWLALEDQRFI